jgi:hypothetical protein
LFALLSPLSWGGQVGGSDPRWTSRQQLLDRGVPIAAAIQRGRGKTKKKQASKPASGFVAMLNSSEAKASSEAGRRLKKQEVVL